MGVEVPSVVRGATCVVPVGWSCCLLRRPIVRFNPAPPPMLEAEHIVAIYDIAQKLTRTNHKRARLLRYRDKLIRAALEDGVSDRALAIAASMKRANISKIRNPPPRTEPLLVPAIGVHAVNAAYPCCGREARFSDTDSLDPGAVVRKRCIPDKVDWIVSRVVIADTPMGRVDELQWKSTTEKEAP